MSDTYTTPEGFELPKKLVFPDVRDFSDLYDYQGEWDFKLNHDYPQRGISNFCSIRLSQLGGSAHRSIRVQAGDLLLEAVRDRIGSYSLSTQVIGHKATGRALVLLQYSQIIGDVWLAYIDPATIPPAPAEVVTPIS